MTSSVPPKFASSLLMEEMEQMGGTMEGELPLLPAAGRVRAGARIVVGLVDHAPSIVTLRFAKKEMLARDS